MIEEGKNMSGEARELITLRLKEAFGDGWYDGYLAAKKDDEDGIFLEDVSEPEVISMSEKSESECKLDGVDLMGALNSDPLLPTEGNLSKRALKTRELIDVLTEIADTVNLPDALKEKVDFALGRKKAEVIGIR